MSAVASTIDAVTVYRRGARVIRFAEIRRQNGDFPERIRIDGLPLCLDDSSVRVRLDATDAATLPTAKDFRVVLATVDPDPTRPPPDDDVLRSARDNEARLVALLAQNERELEELPALALKRRPRGERGKPPDASPNDARLALLELRREREVALRRERRQLRRDLRELQERRQELADKKRRDTSARQAHEHELRKTVVVALGERNAEAKRARIIIEYFVPGARWAPSYTVRFDDALTHATLEMRAVVAQQSGEDWSDVSVTLSTADAHSWTELPDMSSLRIGRVQPAPKKRGWRAPPRGAGDLFADFDREFGPAAEEPAAWGRAAPKSLAASAPVRTARDELTETSEWAKVTTEVLAGDDLDAVSNGPQPPQAGGAAPPPGMGMPPPAAASFSASAAAPIAAQAQLGGGLFAGRAGSTDLFDAVDNPTGTYEVSTTLEVQARSDMLDYGRLTMSAADNDTRGRLTLLSRRDLYMSLMLREETQIDVMTAVHTATDVAQHIHAAPPPRHSLVWSDDHHHAYPTDAPVDIPSDGDFHSVPVSSTSAVARLLHIAVPRESRDVFRIACIDNPLDAPLLAGPVDVYIGPEFLVSSEVDTTPRRGEIRLGLGVDQAVKVARNVQYGEKSAGLMGGSLVLEHSVEIEIVNHSGDNIELEVRERVPVLQEGEDDIKMEVREVSPAWEKFEPFPSAAHDARLRGGHRWMLSLNSGDQQQLHINYSLRIASKNELVGGNRRES